jgi:xanthine dehydrogenase YagR molybdenum-binding subunit
VLEILTHRTIGKAIKPTKLFSDGSYVGSTMMPLASDQIWYAGQIVAVVLAESFEAAREAVHRLEATYVAGEPSAGFDSAGRR